MYAAESIPFYIRDLGMFSRFYAVTRSYNSQPERDLVLSYTNYVSVLYRNGTRHLYQLVLQLRHSHQLAKIRRVFHSIRSLHVVLWLVHNRLVPYLPVSQPSSSEPPRFRN